MLIHSLTQAKSHINPSVCILTATQRRVCVHEIQWLMCKCSCKVFC